MNNANLQKVFYAHEHGKDKIFINGEWLTGEWVERNILYGSYLREQSIEDIIDEPVEYIGDSASKCTDIIAEKDATKIFENDIIKYDDGNVSFTGKVSKRGEEWGIITNRSLPSPYGQRYNFVSFWDIVRITNDYERIFNFMTNSAAKLVPYVEVIGNIYNPESLKN